MKSILASAALSLMLSTSAFADAHSMKLNTYQVEQSSDIYASTFIGMRVYAEEENFDAINDDTMVTEADTKEWDDVGEVNDVILGRNGEVRAVILGIGGFIGLGEKDVAVSMKDIRIVNEKDDEGDFFLVIKANKQALTDAEEFKRAEMVKAEAEAEAEDAEKKAEAATEEVKQETAEASNEVKEEAAEAEAEVKEETAEANAAVNNAAANPDRPMMNAPTVERDGYREAKLEELTTETLTGARVYGSNDEDVGEVDRIMLDSEGKITDVVLDIGGFLGLGEHSIAVTMDELRLLRGEDGGDLRVYIDATQSELEKQPAYKG